MCRLETVTTPASPNKYQGKEYDDEHGLNMYDFHARMGACPAFSGDATLGCWHVPDPMHQYASGYMAMGDNPAALTDPTGMFNLRKFFTSAYNDFIEHWKLIFNQRKGIYNENNDNNEIKMYLSLPPFDLTSTRVVPASGHMGGSVNGLSDMSSHHTTTTQPGSN